MRTKLHCNDLHQEMKEQQRATSVHNSLTIVQYLTSRCFFCLVWQMDMKWCAVAFQDPLREQLHEIYNVLAVPTLVWIHSSGNSFCMSCHWLGKFFKRSLLIEDWNLLQKRQDLTLPKKELLPFNIGWTYLKNLRQNKSLLWTACFRFLLLRLFESFV